MGDISLKPFQQPHFTKIMEIMKNWFVYVDHSKTGSGKTVVTTTVARAMGLDILLIAPPILHKQWQDTVKRYGGTRIIMALSYQKLRNAKAPKGDRPILAKDVGGGEDYGVTSHFQKLLNHGVLIVFDEFHNVKNGSTKQLESAHTLIKALVQTPNTVSRCALLSATPGDRAEHALSMLKMMGICTHENLLPDGINEIIKFAELVDPMGSLTLTTEVDDMKKIKKREAVKIAYEAYRDIFGPAFTSACGPPQISQTQGTDGGGNNCALKHLRLNGFYQMPPDDEDLLRNTYESLVNTLSYNEVDNSIRMDKTKLGTISKCMQNMEASKVRTMARLARNVLTKDANRKVILYFNFTDPINNCSKLLSEFRPAILNGSTGDADRDRILDLFQKPTSDLRVIITHPSVGGVGVCLDDTHGNFPRTQFISPSYAFISTCQAMGRVARSSTKSSSESFLVFCKNLSGENRLLNSMSRKAMTVRTYTASSSSSLLLTADGNNSAGGASSDLYPGEYDQYIENDIPQS